MSFCCLLELRPCLAAKSDTTVDVSCYGNISSGMTFFSGLPMLMSMMRIAFLSSLWVGGGRKSGGIIFWYELCFDKAAGSLAPPLLALLASLLNIG